MSNAALDQDLATMTDDEKRAAIDGLKIQMAILKDQQARMSELRGLILAGVKYLTRLTTQHNHAGHKGAIARLTADVAAYRLELADLDALWTEYATA